MTRRGFTLVEVLIVLAVLAILAGIAWPAVVRFSGDQRIKDAAENVRKQLDATRYRAIDGGMTYQFRFEPDGTKFFAAPAEREGLPVAAPTGLANAAPPQVFPSLRGELGSGLTFAYAGNLRPAGERVGEEWLAGLPDGRKLAESAWSPAVLFRPDGTATGTAFRIADGSGRFVEITVRELTGMASTTPLGREPTRGGTPR